MHMHYAPTLKRAVAKDPMCGYVALNDEICTTASLCTCPECLDWITDPDSPRPVSVEEFEQGARYCICADPENCTEPVPGYICRHSQANPEGSPK